MKPLEQIERWVAGENVHNTVLDECCPDFACCQPNNHFSPELRAKFLQLYREGGLDACQDMLLLGLSGLFAGAGVNARIVNDTQHEA